MQVCLTSRFNLHSNMDRFERTADLPSITFEKYLHSNMDRFERIRIYLKQERDRNLHSNMDRFERWIGSRSPCTVWNIYIPIWIDLKGNVCGCFRSSLLDLHSNMDRFESHSGESASFTLSYLHSNMDRFESMSLRISCLVCSLFTFQYG